jgi:hypothetical protein
MKYSEQLKDKRWQRKRSKILLRDKYACTKCGNRENLNVHHLYYVRGNLAWEYPHNALIVLCKECHEKWHNENVVEVRNKAWNKNEEYCPITKKRGRGKPKKKEYKRSPINEEKRIRMRIVGYMGGKGSKEKIDLISNCDITEEEKLSIAIMAKPMNGSELKEYLKYKGYLKKVAQESKIQEV